MNRLERQYRRIARSLSNAQLMASSVDEGLTAEDLVPAREHRGSHRFLDFYGDEGLSLVLDRFGFREALAERGYGEVGLETHATDQRHTLFVTAELDGRTERLVEVVAQRDRLVPSPPPEGFDCDRPLDLLTIEWLTLRHPLGRFGANRPRMPGQDAPGLGLGEQVLHLFYRAVERLRLDGLLAVPAHFHLGVLYALELPYFDPWYAAQLQVLEALLLLRHQLTLAQASWAVEWGHVRYADQGEPLRWRGQAMIWPSCEELRRYYGSKEYHQQVATAAAMQHYRFEAEAFAEQWEEERRPLEGAD